MTFEQAFEKIKAKFDTADTKKLSSDFAIQVNMTDSDCGGAFYIQFAGGELRVEPYDYRDNTADVSLKKMDLYKILDGKLDVEKAIETGKLYVKGNAADFAAAAGCIVHVEKPKAVKKTATKKAPAKKAEKAAAAKAEAKPVAAKPAAKTEAKPAAKAATKAEAKPVAKTTAKK